MSLETRLSALATRIGQIIKQRGVPAGGTVGQSIVKTGAGDYAFGWGTTSGGSAATRLTATVTSSQLANNVTELLTVPLAKGYALYQVTLSGAGWLRIYRDTASRTADASRDQTTDPAPGSGVVAEVIGTLGVWDQAVSGWDGKTPPDGVIPLRLTNLSGAAQAITVTLTYLPLEA
ncbi:hypothetical protein [Deinococcus sp. QL22]|uniref:hypothetical protein n=1 Tax=Deinococcus sp. QL22 TaxID=2939437 RepID=UPI002016B3CC|nr:hypothetical protein [Deinococcus sp. QL22]UQN05439.1 hypothetical protein M1R55_11195 [Deinococcus sp. QL22]